MIWKDEDMSVDGSSPVDRGYSLWRNRDYLLLWSGQSVSMLGSSISGLAFPLLVLSLTHSPAQAGLVSALGVLPYAILGLPAGALVDRWNRKRVMIVCDGARLVAAGSIGVGVIVGHLTLLPIYLATLVSGTAFVFFSIAETSSLRHVVPVEQLPEAVSRNQVGSTACGLVGSLIGGALYQVRHAFPFLLDALSYGASVVGLMLISTGFQDERAVQTRQLRREVFDGIRWLMGQGLLRVMWALNAAMAFVGGGFVPDELQGRVNSAFMIVAISASPLGRLLTGTLFQVAGGAWTAVVLALCLAVLALVETLSSSVRGAPSLGGTTAPCKNEDEVEAAVEEVGA